MKRRTHLLLLGFLLLGLYYPAIFVGVNSLDDERMMDWISSLAWEDIPSLFTTSGGYYRPLLMVSYVFDHILFGQIESILHFENILLHLLNALLVYLLAERLLCAGNESKWQPFFAALIFAVHPVNVESVAWISGRSDLLCTFFILLAAVAIHGSVAGQRNGYSFLAASLAFLGCLVKELAFFSLPALALLAIYLEGYRGDVSFTVKNLNYRKVAGHLVPLVMAGGLYLTVRLGAAPKGFVENAASLPGVGHHGALQSVEEVFRAYGLYFKKLIFPYPLNFAIIHVSNYYAWIGVGVLACIGWFARKKNLYGVMCGMIVVVLLSAVYVAIRKVAWTPYAERYLYLATAFLAIGLVDAVRVHMPNLWGRPLFVAAVLLLLTTVAATTVQRVILWQSNQALYEDTVKKTPDFAPLRNQLAIALMENNRYTEALEQIDRGKSAGHQGDKVLLYINQAMVEVEKKNFDRAEAILLQTCRPHGKYHPEVLKAFINVYERKLVFDKNGDHVAVRRKLMKLHEKHYLQSGDTMHLYRTGQLALSLNDRKKAFECFSTVAFKAPVDAYFREPARKLALKCGTVKK